jgi:hypothetical protein
MATKLTRLIHKISIELHLVTESCTICSSRSWRPVRKHPRKKMCLYYEQVAWLSCVCMYSYQPEGWLDPHTEPAPDAHTHTHTHTHTFACTAHPIPPLRGVLSQELNGVGWPVPFPLLTTHSQVTMKCITWLKIFNTNLIYLHHPQADSNS